MIPLHYWSIRRSKEEVTVKKCVPCLTRCNLLCQTNSRVLKELRTRYLGWTKVVQDLLKTSSLKSKERQSVSKEVREAKTRIKTWELESYTFLSKTKKKTNYTYKRESKVCMWM